jgi:hypothetical protein
MQKSGLSIVIKTSGFSLIIELVVNLIREINIGILGIISIKPIKDKSDILNKLLKPVASINGPPTPEKDTFLFVTSIKASINEAPSLSPDNSPAMI